MQAGTKNKKLTDNTIVLMKECGWSVGK